MVITSCCVRCGIPSLYYFAVNASLCLTRAVVSRKSMLRLICAAQHMRISAYSLLSDWAQRV